MNQNIEILSLIFYSENKSLKPRLVILSKAFKDDV